ncbi:serine hydrolase domain-containing protein [Hymenobacter sublimis]|uniref:Beta-lactamase family protein n=1 Tax=Hymenobacter sublimis TaxID=2933777 RepID=A0ABY4J438_9BACT|nr:serine hydrolase domain-containing protein [Hymenobacter sublimis]UPL47555.1 beta-lactamase family protein [Hymenobacter sublimis]
MARYLLLIFLLLTTSTFAQNSFSTLVTTEHEAGRFNGALLVVKDGQIISQINKGYANFQFAVPITSTTRFPIASMTKLFTAILILQLVEKSLLKLDDKASLYLPDLPAACQTITLAELLTHCSGLQNEPSTQVYQTRYSTAEFVKKFIVKNESRKAPAFNYNNLDYILLTRILEVVSKQSFPNLVRHNILIPLRMHDTGVVQESRIIPNLAYGYHNYTFGAGSSKDTLRNDAPKYLSNYAGAGAMYSTVTDLYKLLLALQTNTLLTAKTTAKLLLKPQQAVFVDQARGYPTAGFYYNDQTFTKPVLERRGSIDGFNSVLLTDPAFRKAVLILSNTDTGDLEQLADKLYTEIH